MFCWCIFDGEMRFDDRFELWDFWCFGSLESEWMNIIWWLFNRISACGGSYWSLNLMNEIPQLNRCHSRLFQFFTHSFSSFFPFLFLFNLIHFPPSFPFLTMDRNAKRRKITVFLFVIIISFPFFGNLFFFHSSKTHPLPQY